MNRINRTKVQRWVIGLLPYCFFVLFPFHMTTAQTVKSIAVSQGVSYTDHVSLKPDAKDMDLMVKFVFNEADNTLSVRLISYRSLFVFWDNTSYKQAIRRRWIRPSRLSYVVSSNLEDRFRLTKTFRNELPKPYKKHIFKKWIEYEGLQPTDTTLQMVNDYIEQTFNIQNKRTNVTVRLRDLMFMDEVRQKGTASYYEVSYGKDLNTEYQITIQRDPCFGLEADLDAASQSLADLQKSYNSFNSRFGSRKVTSQESLTLFENMKNTLLIQFPVRTADSPCPDLQDTWNQYNQLIDSISQMTCTLQTVGELGSEHAGSEGLDAAKVFSRARQIDEMVSRWMLSTDTTERKDIVQLCEQIIKEINSAIKSRSVSTDDQRRAVQVFRDAERYFKITCFE